MCVLVRGLSGEGEEAEMRDERRRLTSSVWVRCRVELLSHRARS